jgi:hypothetical protein
LSPGMEQRRQKVAMLHKGSAPFPPPEYTTLLSKKGRSLQARLVRLQNKQNKAQKKAARSNPIVGLDSRTEVV